MYQAALRRDLQSDDVARLIRFQFVADSGLIRSLEMGVSPCPGQSRRV